VLAAGLQCIESTFVVRPHRRIKISRRFGLYYVVFFKLKMATNILSKTSEKLHTCIRTETRNQAQRIKLNFLWLVMDQMQDIQAVVAGRSGLSLIIITNHANKYSDGHLNLHTITFIHLFQSRKNYSSWRAESLSTSQQSPLLSRKVYILHPTNLKCTLSYWWLVLNFICAKSYMSSTARHASYDRSFSTYRGADKSLARPGRKQANVSIRVAWISFGVLPCRKKKSSSFKRADCSNELTWQRWKLRTG